MNKRTVKQMQRILLVGIAFFSAIFVASSSTALADSTGAIYSFNLQDANSSVSNEAVNGPNVSLELTGNYIASSEGVEFFGDTQSQLSAGYATVNDGFTLDVGTDKAFGVGAVFSTDFSTQSCLDDTQNITQVGRFAPGQTQVKLQLGRCDSDGGLAEPECRIVGVDSPSGTTILKGRPFIADGGTYSFTCVKNIEREGSATVRLVATDLTTGATDVRYHTIPATGILVSDRTLSVANKSPQPNQASNSDQFTGTITSVSYCDGIHVGAVDSCLEQSLVGDEIVSPDENAPDPNQPTHFEILADRLDSERQQGPKWVQEQWSAPVSGEVAVTFNWVDPTVQMRFRIDNLTTGEVVMWPGESRPDYAPGMVRTFSAQEGHEYAVSAWSRSGASNFDVQLSW